MASRNLERARQFLEEFNRRDAEAGVDYLAPDVVLHPFAEWPGPTRYDGIEGFRQLVAEWTEHFDGYRWDAAEFHDATDDRVLVLARHTGLTKGEQVPVEQAVAVIWRFHGDRITEGRFFLTWDEAREAAGES